MRWPFESWGADVVFAGHDHVYERSKVGGIRHITVGLSGNEIYPFGAPIPESEVRFSTRRGRAAGDRARRRDLVSVLRGRRRRGRLVRVVQALPPLTASTATLTTQAAAAVPFGARRSALTSQAFKRAAISDSALVGS